MNRQNAVDTSLSTQATERSSEWGDEITWYLIRHAARNGPPDLAERLEEEWLADLAARQGKISRLLFGLGCCWAMKVIAREHCTLNVTAATKATGSATMVVQAQLNPTVFPRRTTALVAIIGVHAAVIYAFATGLGHQFIKELEPTFAADFIQEARPKDTPPPPPKVDMQQPPQIDLGPPPDIPIDGGPDTGAIGDETRPPIVDTSPLQPPPALVRRVSGGPGKGFPNSEDYYPPAARRLGEQGNTAIQVCVDPSGKLTAEPTVMQSSGSVRLDEGAIRLAKAGSGHYRATTENGTPVSSCYGYVIKFNLQ